MTGVQNSEDYLFASQPVAAHARNSRNDRDPEIPRRPRICGRCRHGPSAWCHKQKACATSIFGQKCLRAEGASLRPCSQHRFDSCCSRMLADSFRYMQSAHQSRPTPNPSCLRDEKRWESAKELICLQTSSGGKMRELWRRANAPEGARNLRRCRPRSCSSLHRRRG